MKKKTKLPEEKEKFIIYQVFRPKEHAKAIGRRPSIVASPLFGTNVADRQVYYDNAGEVNIDSSLDYARKGDEKHITEEEMKKAHGTKYYEFDILDNEKILESTGGVNNESHDQTIVDNEARKVKENKKEKKPFTSLIGDLDTLEEEAKEETNISTIDEFDTDADFDLEIEADDEKMTNNSYSKSMPKPKPTSIPSFLVNDVVNDEENVEEEINEDEEIEVEEILPDEEYLGEEIPYSTVEENEELSFNDIPTIVAPEIEFDDSNVVVEEPKKVKPVKVKDENPYKNYSVPYKKLFRTSSNSVDNNPAWLEEKKEIINNTLKAFGIDGEVINYIKGPTVTLYEIKLQPGVLVKKINQIHENLQMNLKTESVRIISPIPGKDTVGVEAPNDTVDMVAFGDICNDEYMNLKGNLKIALGKDTAGMPVYPDITEMPHALIAGATKSGKSVCINSIIVSLITKNSPENLKLILVDPKKVEMSFYEGIPHLATPIIDDPYEAAEALKWACAEMDRRYDVLYRNRVKKIDDYLEKRKQYPELEPMPFIVVIVDEFNDLIMQCGPEVNDCIIRLAQKARACGMHVILATQRPTVDVVNGTIKANIACRISFYVTSSSNSSTILDETGAEKLLGRGDMLIKNNAPTFRAQGCYISDDEIVALCDYLCNKYQPDYVFTHEDLRNSIAKSQAQSASGLKDSQEDRELAYEVACFCIAGNACSINAIQKNFGMGFNKAQSIVEYLQELKVVSPKQGTKPREILVDDYELRKIFDMED